MPLLFKLFLEWKMSFHFWKDRRSGGIFKIDGYDALIGTLLTVYTKKKLNPSSFYTAFCFRCIKSFQTSRASHKNNILKAHFYKLFLLPHAEEQD